MLARKPATAIAWFCAILRPLATVRVPDDVAAPVADPAGWSAVVAAAAAASRDRKLAGADLPPAVAASRRALARRFDDRPPNTVTWGFPVVPRATPPSECGFHLPESLDPLPVDVSSSLQSSRAACEDTGTFYQWGISLIALNFRKLALLRWRTRWNFVQVKKKKK